jgi:hypothetical protein
MKIEIERVNLPDYGIRWHTVQLLHADGAALGWIAGSRMYPMAPEYRYMVHHFTNPGTMIGGVRQLSTNDWRQAKQFALTGWVN